MFKEAHAFSGFSVDDLAKAKQFYHATLGLAIREEMGLVLKLATGGEVFVYQKDNHQPATYTVLNFPVDDIDAAAGKLADAGIELIHYEGLTDADGIARGRAQHRGPDIAWFNDPAGNILSILHEG